MRLSAIAAALGRGIHLARRASGSLVRAYQLSLLEKHGEDVYIGPNCTMTWNTISLGSNVYVGTGCVIQSAHGRIVIGNHVMIGPGANIHGGNHIYDRLGEYMDDVRDKPVGIDGVIQIENDVWIGANAIILAGVTVGEGSIVAAGGSSCVTCRPTQSLVAIRQG